MPYFLAQTTADIDAYLENHQNDRGVIGLDTEYTSLDMKKAKIVGVSVSLVPETGLYMPFGHKGGDKISIPLASAVAVCGDSSRSPGPCTPRARRGSPRSILNGAPSSIPARTPSFVTERSISCWPSTRAAATSGASG